MEQRPPSQTARVVAGCRAIHTLLADEPKLLNDPFARGFAGFATDQELIDWFSASPLSRLPYMRSVFSLRSRWVEDELAATVEQGGVTQYVILGAGLDSFAYRRPDLMDRITVFEVDHPGSQAWKRERAAELGLQAPARLVYAPVDFEHQTLAEGLGQAGFDFGAPVFVSMIGVAMYLTRAAVLRTWRDIATLSRAPVTFVLECPRSLDELSEADAETVRTTAAEAAAQVGEPWITFFGRNELKEVLRSSGFSKVLNFDPAAAHARYLHDRKDGAAWPNFTMLVRADRI
jgi:methyltransferase (TIGR00027 family)